jgi:hypothetical protein
LTIPDKLMDHVQEDSVTRDRSVKALRWVARVWSIASVGLICAFLLAEGLPPFTANAMLFPFGVMLGLILAWRFERIGGLAAALSIVLFYVLEYASNGRLPKGYAFMLISAPGVIFLCCGYLRSLNDSNPPPK